MYDPFVQMQNEMIFKELVSISDLLMLSLLRDIGAIDNVECAKTLKTLIDSKQSNLEMKEGMMNVQTTKND